MKQTELIAETQHELSQLGLELTHKQIRVFFHALAQVAHNNITAEGDFLLPDITLLAYQEHKTPTGFKAKLKATPRGNMATLLKDCGHSDKDLTQKTL